MKCLHKNSLKNAIIQSVTIGIEDHGFLTMDITLNYGRSGQSLRGCALWAKGWEKKPNYFSAFYEGEK